LPLPTGSVEVTAPLPFSLRTFGRRLLVFLVVYLPMEDFLLSRVSPSGEFFAISRQGSDALVLLLALVAVGLRLTMCGRTPRLGGGADWALGGFLGIVALSITLNDGDPIESALNVKAQLRHATLLYSIPALGLTGEDVQRVLRAFLLIFAVQIAIGLLGVVGGSPVRSFFRVMGEIEGPGGIEYSFTSARPGQERYISGTMGHNIAYGFFLLTGLAVWLVQMSGRKMHYAGGAVAALACMYFSGSRIAFLVGVTLIAMHQVYIHGWRRLILPTLVLIPFCIGYVIANGDELARENEVLAIFTERYRENALTQRLGIAVYIVPRMITSTPMLGYGPDIESAVRGIYADPVFSDVPVVLLGVLMGILEDVYWVALVFYYGFIGVGLLVFFLWRLWEGVRKRIRYAPSAQARALALSARYVLVSAVPMNFINQAFEVRQFAFYLWLLVALTWALANRLEAEQAPAGAPAPS